MRFLLATLSLLLGSFFAYAQNGATNQPANSKVISGNFDIDKGLEHLNIVYLVYPDNNNQYVLELSGASPLALSAVIMDKDGNKVSELKPTETSHSYKHAFGTATSGVYTIYVKHNGNVVKTISTKND